MAEYINDRIKIAIDDEEEELGKFWTDDSDNEAERPRAENETESSVQETLTRHCESRKELSVLETLDEDVSSLILCHLSLDDIANVSLVSRNLCRAARSTALWKTLFHRRWNVKYMEEISLDRKDLAGSHAANDSADSGEHDNHDYATAYREAHAHPHVLWITHWNCVYPSDGLSPGRCYIASKKGWPKKTGRQDCIDEGIGSVPGRYCPHCRDPNYWDALDNGQVNSQAQAMALATALTRQKFRKRLSSSSLLDSTPSCPTANRRAFETSATFHRRLQTRQYERGSTNFLTDLLFFNLTDPIHSDGQWELERLLVEARSGLEGVAEAAGGNVNNEILNNTGSRDPLYETSHHSWHIIRLTNPDFYRPIVYQFGIQRPECFTAYPSEGFISPGDTICVTLGVRPLGSALCYAFESLNVQRDGLDAEWANLYSDEAHLPLAPFIVRYRFATTQPFWTENLEDPTKVPPDRHVSNPGLNAFLEKPLKEVALEYNWRQDVPSHHMRSIPLSVHVNAHYNFHDFLRETCHPFDLLRETNGPILHAPALQEVFPKIYRRLENVPREERRLLQVHSEGPCVRCRQPWCLRDEELLHAYIVMRGECEWHFERRILVMRNLLRCIRLMSNNSSMGTTLFNAALVYKATCIVLSLKAAPWLSERQLHVLVRWEVVLDCLYREVSAGEEDGWRPWRLNGVYRFVLCTDSVFRRFDYSKSDLDTVWKEEPGYLETFRHLAHSPGRFCLGPQEDPNHLGEVVIRSSRRYFRVQKSLGTDLFMDDPIFSLQAGICMVHDPRSLVVHGLYDRIPYAGTLVRRPKVFSALLFGSRDERLRGDQPPPKKSGFVVSRKRLRYYELQDTCDTHSICTVFSPGDAETASSNTSLSMRNYLSAVPPPGSGRFALCGTVDTDDGTGRSRLVSLDFDEGSKLGSVGLRHGEGRGDNEVEMRSQRNRMRRDNNRGPRIFHLFWFLAAQLGLIVDDRPESGSVFVDRRILIATQWLCISLMVAPLLLTLCARYAQWIPARPLDYELEGLPFQVTNEMRFLSEGECGLVAVALLCLWLALGRWTERHLSRDFFRVMLEHVSPRENKIHGHLGFWSRLHSSVMLRLQRQWDFACPLFLQRRVFTPHWNRRLQHDLFKHISYWQSQNLDEQQKEARAMQLGRVFGDSRDEGIDIGSDSFSRNMIVGIVVALGSFCSSSPHFWLNLFTVFSCGISLGMSVSLYSMEKGASFSPRITATGFLIRRFSLRNVVILSFLIGQLVGSSGGTMFLAEFIVTTISLVLGGTGTVSASAMESWACCFCLSMTAFWGYSFGRVALMDSVRQKRSGFSSVLLTNSLILICIFWVLVFVVSKWDSPIDLLINETSVRDGMQPLDPEIAAKFLQ